ncbi:MAG: bestrophin family ion channel [Planctomycetota bacterium]|nr:bestrophin family ion channel [Planctomycetota bacterium]
MLVRYKLPFHYLFACIWLDYAITFFLAIVSFITFRVTNLPLIPLSIPAFLGTSISLLLAFKLSQSYDRWWEARKIWGAIVNDSRTLALQVRNFYRGDDLDRPNRIAKRQIAWVYSLGQTLRDMDPIANIECLIDANELNEVKQFKNVPYALINKHGQDLKKLYSEGQYNEYQQVQIDETLVRLVDSMGKAERIKKTVFPTTYRVFLRLFTFVFILMLSIALAETDGIWEIPILMLIAGPFFLMEKTAFFLQDPFQNRPTDTPVTSIAKTIDVDIRQIIGNQQFPEPEKVQGFYLM